jgi:tetratricopeptide (TPR) repeat protein
MSVIYRSLQQLKQQESERVTRSTPQAVAPRMSKLIIRALIYLGIFVILVWAGLFFINQEVQEVSIPEAPDTFREERAVSEASAEQTEAAQETEVPEIKRTVIEEPGEELQLNAQPILKERLRVPKPVEQPEPVDLTKPSKALENHFADKARNNEDILALERKLSQSLESGRIDESKELLHSINEKLGDGESATKIRWDGYLALKERNYELAEGKFRKALSKNPNDFVSSINLTYALMGQGKMQEARELYRKLIDRHPMNEKVLSLGNALATR